MRTKKRKKRSLSIELEFLRPNSTKDSVQSSLRSAFPLSAFWSAGQNEATVPTSLQSLQLQSLQSLSPLATLIPCNCQLKHNLAYCKQSPACNFPSRRDFPKKLDFTTYSINRFFMMLINNIKRIIMLDDDNVSSYVKQARRHGGSFRDRAPSNDCLCPPKQKLRPPQQGLCPEEINRLRFTGVQIEA